MENKREIVIRKILHAVRAGRYEPSKKLPPERSLATEFGVSRVLLREAVVALETMGVLEVRQRQGIFVKSPATRSFEDNLRFLPFLPMEFVPQLMEMRLIIDVPAARLAAARRTEIDMQRIRQCLGRIEDIVPETEEAIGHQAHYEFLFHSLLVEAAHNPILARVYEGMVSLMEKNNEVMHRNLVRDRDWSQEVVGHHRRIAAAVEARDPEGAAAAMQRHIIESRERIAARLTAGQLAYSIGNVEI